MNITLCTGARFIPFTLVAVCLAAPSVAPAQNGPDRAALADAIARGSEAERAAAVAAIREIPVAERGPLIRSALLEQLDRQRLEIEDRRRALEAGRPLPPPADHGESLFRILDLVVQYEDPGIIGALLPFIGTGNRVVNALVAFGELAVSDVANVAASDERSKRDVSAALLALRRMLDRPGRHPLSQASKRRVIDVARQRLEGTEDPTVVLRAIHLALATGDAGLKERVRKLARDAGAVRGLGITDAGLAEYIQNGAAAALAARGSHRVSESARLRHQNPTSATRLRYQGPSMPRPVPPTVGRSGACAWTNSLVFHNVVVHKLT